MIARTFLLLGLAFMAMVLTGCSLSREKVIDYAWTHEEDVAADATGAIRDKFLDSANTVDKNFEKRFNDNFNKAFDARFTTKIVTVENRLKKLKTNIEDLETNIENLTKRIDKDYYNKEGTNDAIDRTGKNIRTDLGKDIRENSNNIDMHTKNIETLPTKENVRKMLDTLEKTLKNWVKIEIGQYDARISVAEANAENALNKATKTLETIRVELQDLVNALGKLSKSESNPAP